MSAAYDMCVDYETLIQIEDKLQKIEYDLLESTKRMTDAIQRSEDFLAGRQFEKAKNTTKACTVLTERTSGNIRNARVYIDSLKSSLEEYCKCGYSGEV